MLPNANTSHDFQPFIADPLLMGGGLRDSLRRQYLPYTMLLLFAVCLTTGIVSSGGFRFLADVADGLCVELPNLSSRLAPPNCAAGGQISSYTFAHDMFSAVTLLILALTPLFVKKQWSAYACLVSTMTSCGALAFRRPEDRAAFELDVSKANLEYFRLRRLAPITLIVFIGLMLSLVYQQSKDGVFAVLASPAGNTLTYSLNSYAGWWAAPGTSVSGFLIYTLLGSLGLYLITIQNYVGSRIILTFWRARKGIIFGADPLDRDGYHGWEAVRRGLRMTYGELAIHGLALALIGVSLPSGVVTIVYVVASIQWAMVLPLYAIFPFIFTKKRIEAYKAREIESLLIEADYVTTGASIDRTVELRQLYSRQIASIRAIPILPFRNPKDLAIFIVGLAADCTAVWLIVYQLAER